jgi:hypothetical protein
MQPQPQNKEGRNSDTKEKDGGKSHKINEKIREGKKED